MSILIGISGKKRTGKNTIAALLKCVAEGTVREVSFAAELKKELARMCSVSVNEIENNKALYRELLQAWGCYRRNKYGKDFWVDKAVQSLSLFTEDVIIFTDVRFENEATRLKEMGGILVRVARDTGSIDTHESEIALDKYDKFDHIILNTGTVGHLLEDVKDLAKKLNIKIKH